MVDVEQIKGLESFKNLEVTGDKNLFELNGYPTFTFEENAGYKIVQIPNASRLTTLAFSLNSKNEAMNYLLFDNQQNKQSVRLAFRSIQYNGNQVGKSLLPYNEESGNNVITIPPLSAVQITFFACENYGVVTASGTLSQPE